MAQDTQIMLDEVQQGTATGASQAASAELTDEGTRFYHGRILDELPGCAFAVLTLVWICASLAGLVW